MDTVFPPEARIDIDLDDAGGRFACPSRRGKRLAHVVALDDGEARIPAHAEHLWDPVRGERVPVGALVRLDATRRGVQLRRVRRRVSPRCRHGVYLGTWWTAAATSLDLAIAQAIAEGKGPTGDGAPS